MLVESNERSTKAQNRLANSLMQLDGAFKYTSYIDRYALFAERLVTGGLYTSCCLLTSKLDDSSPDGINYPSSSLSPITFFDALHSHLTRAIANMDVD